MTLERLLEQWLCSSHDLTLDATDVMLTIEPRIFSDFMWFDIACDIKKGPRALHIICQSKSSEVVVSRLPRSVVAAAFTRPEIFDRSLIVEAHEALILAGSDRLVA